MSATLTSCLYRGSHDVMITWLADWLPAVQQARNFKSFLASVLHLGLHLCKLRTIKKKFLLLPEIREHIDIGSLNVMWQFWQWKTAKEGRKIFYFFQLCLLVVPKSLCHYPKLIIFINLKIYSYQPEIVKFECLRVTLSLKTMISYRTFFFFELFPSMKREVTLSVVAYDNYRLRTF